MITENDLREAIAECQGTRNPDAKTCMKLAAFYTILDHMTDDSETGSDKSEDSGRSYSAKPVAFGTQEEVVLYRANSEFSQVINGKSSQSMWAIMDELMSMIQMLEPKLYSAVMRKIEEVQ